MDENEVNVIETPAQEVESSPQSSYSEVDIDNSSMPVSNGNIGYSIASMVCGILSILCCCFTYLGIILAIAAIVLGIVSLKKNADGRGMAIAGLITGGVGAVLAIIVLIMAAGASSVDPNELSNEIMNSLDL